MAQPAPGENTLIRTAPCETCGARMLWTQAAWSDPESGQLDRAAYRCDNGHVLDPAESPQCPHCGVHDTGRWEAGGFKCRRCAALFSVPR